MPKRKATKQTVAVSVEPTNIEHPVAISQTNEEVKSEPPKPEPQAATAPTQNELKQTKQGAAVMALVTALKENRQIEVTPEQLRQDGKYINVVLGEQWPTVAIGPTGGYSLPQIRSYSKADVLTMIKADELLAKQNAKDAKKAVKPATATPAQSATA